MAPGPPPGAPPPPYAGPAPGVPGPPAGYPAPGPAPVVAMTDPHELGMAVARLSNSARKAGRAALAVASVLLEAGELVECVVQGKVNDLDGVAVLTDRRILVLNDRQWQPDQISFAYDAALGVQGIAEGGSATLTLQRDGVMARIVRIGDVPLAQEAAQRIRARSMRR